MIFCMNYVIKLGSQFKKRFKLLAKKYHNIVDDLEELKDELLSNPALGVDLGGGIRKVRMAISDKNRGKSHGARVITYTLYIDEENGIITLLTIYDKGDRQSITSEEIKELLTRLELEKE